MLVRIHIIWKYLHGFTSILVGTWINHKITTILFIPSAKNNYSFHYFSISPYITVQFIWRDILESELLQLELVLFYLHSWNICRLCVFYLFNVATFEFVPFQFQSVPSSVRYIFASLKPIWHSHSLLLYWGVLQYQMTLLKIYTHTKARVQCTVYSTQYYNAIRSKNNAWNCSIMYHWHSPDFIHICITRSFSIVWVYVRCCYCLSVSTCESVWTKLKNKKVRTMFVYFLITLIYLEFIWGTVWW